MSYHEVCERFCPDYLAMGMTWEEYWHGDPCMTRYFLKAHEMKRQEKNFELWLQGAYVYEALVDVAPLLHAFSKNPRPQKYPSEPYALTKKEIEAKKKREEAAEFERMKAEVSAWMTRVNRAKTESASKGANNG